MLKSIWMNAWDLQDVEHAELIGFLKDCGLNACNLGLSYHGGRMLLPRHRRYKIYEQHAGALYFPADRRRYRNLRLQPHVAPEAALVRPFVEACARAGFEVNAWTVLCHNDHLGASAPECCVENAFGDRYTYALCPSNADVRRYVVGLCADVASFDGIGHLDLEALSFMGYEHASPHDKRGVPLTKLITWLLSVCFCEACRARLGSRAADELRRRARRAVNDYLEELPDAESGGADLRIELETVLGAEGLGALLEMRSGALTTLLDEVRDETKGTRLNLRLATSPLFHGGKTALSLASLEGRVDSATVTFLGTDVESMRGELNRLPAKHERMVPLYGGFMFHHPDCASERDVRERVRLLDAAQLDGHIFYGFGMAAGKHFTWLKNALTKGF